MKKGCISDKEVGALNRGLEPLTNYAIDIVFCRFSDDFSGEKS